MRSANRWVSFVTKLNRQTQEGRIRWRFVGDQEDFATSDFQRYGPAYIAEIDDATVRIYSLKTLREENYWMEDIILEVQTSETGDLVRIPGVSGLEDLYESVKYKTNKIDEFVDRFLNEQ